MDWTVNSALKTYKDMEPKNMVDMALLPHTDPMHTASESSEKGNTLPTGKPRKKTMTSVFLKYFETAPDGRSRSCKFCGQSYSIATATGNLGRHLANRHPGYDKTEDVVLSSALQTATQVVTQPTSSAAVVKKPHIQGKAPQVEYDHLNWVLIKWLISASLPPSTLEQKWLTNSYKFLNPSIQLWSPDKYKAVFQEVFRSMREDVRAILEQVSSKVTLSLDFWTSYEQIFYMGVTCQWIDENWSLQRVLLDICKVSYPYGGSEIYSSLVEVLKMYNIESRVLSCTHDNSQNAIHACHTLKGDLDAQKVGPFCYIPCAARTLSSIIEDGLRKTKPLIARIREFVQELNTSIEISQVFIQLTAAYQEGNWKFPFDDSIRWSGNYQMLDLVCKAPKSMDAVIRKNEEMLGSRMMLSAAEKNSICVLHNYLEPFYKITNNICTSKMPTIGLLLFFMDHVSEMIDLCRESRQNPDWLKSAAEEMAKKVADYNSQVCYGFVYMTAILDPRIKCELIPENFNSGNFLEEARAHFLRSYYTTHFSTLAAGYTSSLDIDDSGSVSFAEEIARKKRRASMSNATDELSQYLAEPPAALQTDVLEWWRVNSTRYPCLSVMARDFLAVQATSVIPEELFSSKGMEAEKQHLQMPHCSARAILCIRSWTQGGLRLKYKSTEIDYEKLMELATTPAAAAAAAAGDNNSIGSDKNRK